MLVSDFESKQLAQGMQILSFQDPFKGLSSRGIIVWRHQGSFEIKYSVSMKMTTVIVAKIRYFINSTLCGQTIL